MSKDRAEDGMMGSITTTSSAFINDVMDHTRQTWGNVVQGSASLEEYAEAGAEVVAVAALAKFGASRLLGRGAMAAEGRAAALASEKLVANGLPIAAETRAAIMTPEIMALTPSGRGAAVRGLLGETKIVLGGDRVAGLASEKLMASGLPITAETRAAFATPEILGLNPSERGAAVRGLLGETKTALGSGYYSNPNLLATDGVRGIVGDIKSVGTRVADPLVASGIPIDQVTRGAAMNPGIMALKPGDRGAAIRKIAGLSETTLGQGSKLPGAGGVEGIIGGIKSP